MSYSCDWKTGACSSLIKDANVWKSANCGSCKELRIPDDPSKASGDRLKIPGEYHQEIGREKFSKTMSQAKRSQARHRAIDCVSRAPGDRSHKLPEWLQLFEEGLANSPTHTLSVWNNLQLSQRRKDLMI